MEMFFIIPYRKKVQNHKKKFEILFSRNQFQSQFIFNRCREDPNGSQKVLLVLNCGIALNIQN